MKASAKDTIGNKKKESKRRGRGGTQRKKDCKKNCTDCLHCKVCSCSTKNSNICYCAKSKCKYRELEIYWLNNKICKHFEDMTA